MGCDYCRKIGEHTGRYHCPIHLESMPFAGMETADEDRAAALGISQAEELTARMRTPKADISGKAGRMERDSPLFYGQGDNPLLF